MKKFAPADVCLIVEGAYPYVTGGLSSWAQDLIKNQNHLRFHVVAILPREEEPELKYELPSNVVGMTHIYLSQVPGTVSGRKPVEKHLFDALRGPFDALTTDRANLSHLKQILETLRARGPRSDAFTLLDSEAAFELISGMYTMSFAESSFLDYFWSWRAILGGIYSILMSDLPQAKVYHSVSTGFAGLLLARAKLETGRPTVLTEHGIYTNERRIEINSADWLQETASKTLSVDATRRSLRDMWINTFANYSRICYEAADQIITLFEGNQYAQIADGAATERMRVIPNGVDVERYGSIRLNNLQRPTVALIGRVVPIKDVKSFIRACAILRETYPNLRALVMGPVDEDPAYVDECRAMVEYLGLMPVVEFTGSVKIDQYLPEIAVLTLSSISEAQPLVILEGGACGIPTVATDVGACGELINGRRDEEPRLGPGGVLVPLSSPTAIAQGLHKLLSNREFYTRCSQAIRQRVHSYYNKRDQHAAYRKLYADYMG